MRPFGTVQVALPILATYPIGGGHAYARCCSVIVLVRLNLSLKDTWSTKHVVMRLTRMSDF